MVNKVGAQRLVQHEDEIRQLTNQLGLLSKRLEDFRQRGGMVSALQQRGSPFIPEILAEVLALNFKLPDLPKYDGTKDP